MSRLHTPTRPSGTTATPRDRVRWGDLPRGPRRLAIIVLLLTAWQVYVSVSDVDPLLVVGPYEVGRAWLSAVIDGSLLTAVGATLQILLVGMTIGIVLAAALTTLATWSRFGDDVLALLTAMLNPLPAIAMLPLAIVWFGLNSRALIFVIANAVIWPVAVNVSTGFRTVPPTILAVGRNIGLDGWRFVVGVLIPAALPHTISGLKTAWAFGWRTIIAAELVFGVAGGGGGLGFFINDARYFQRIPEVFAGLASIAIIGVGFDLLFTALERRTVMRWGMKAA